MSILFSVDHPPDIVLDSGNLRVNIHGLNRSSSETSHRNNHIQITTAFGVSMRIFLYVTVLRVLSLESLWKALLKWPRVEDDRPSPEEARESWEVLRQPQATRACLKEQQLFSSCGLAPPEQVKDLR